MRYRVHSLFVTTTLLAMAIGGLHPAPTAAAPLVQTRATSQCITNLQVEVTPAVLLRGETAVVTYRAGASCPISAPLHLVFALGEPGSMRGEPINQLSQAVKTIVRGLQLPGHPSTKVGITAFQTTARTLCKLMNDEGRLYSCAGKLTANGGTAIDRGIIEALKVLGDGRKNLAADVEPNEVMIVVTNGRNVAGCDPVKSATRRAKGWGVRVFTVCVGGGCDAECLRECASSARLFFALDDASQLAGLFDEIRDSVAPTLTHLSVVDTLSPEMELIIDSSTPPAAISDDRRTLTWELSDIGPGGAVLSYRIRPLVAGHHAIGLGALATFSDIRRLSGEATFPIPHISVFGMGDANRSPDQIATQPESTTGEAAFGPDASPLPPLGDQIP